MSNNKRFDIRTRLSNDEVLFINANMGNYFHSLRNNFNIFTVDDFINFDFNKTNLRREQKTRNIAFQAILKSKYLNQPFEFEELLIKKYSNHPLLNDEYRTMVYDFYSNYNKLGFGGFGSSSISRIDDYIQGKYKEKDYDISIIDYILKRYDYILNHKTVIARNTSDALTIFYVNYYNDNLKNKKEEPLDSILTGNASLDLLKSELADLINIRNNLNDKIEELSSVIESIETKQVKVLKNTNKNEF